MIITCGNCHARFKVEPELIKETGSRVRCSNCRFVFTVYRPQGGTPETIVETPPIETTPVGPPQPPEPPENAKTAPPESSDRRPPKTLDEDPLEKLLAELEEGSPTPPGRREPLPGEPSPYWDGDDDLEEPAPPRNRAGRPSRLTNTDARRGPDQENFNPRFLEDDLDLEGPSGEEAAPYPSLNEPYLGLEVSPTGPEKGPAGPEAPQRPADHRAGFSRGRLLLLGAVVAATFLGVGIFVLANRPEPVALFSGDQAAVEEEQSENPPPAAFQSDLEGRNLLGLVQGKLVHHYRTNQEAGELLVLVGQLRNDYPDHRSFIRLNGKLYSPEHVVLAERPVYAGNLLTDEELTTLPITEIYSRLSIKGGRDGSNINVAPGQLIHFMIVFDKLPENCDFYEVEPLSSAPST